MQLRRVPGSEFVDFRDCHSRGDCYSQTVDLKSVQRIHCIKNSMATIVIKKANPYETPILKGPILRYFCSV